RGYLLKRSAAECLISAIRTVHGGGLYIDRAIAARDANRSISIATTFGCGANIELTDREGDVLKFVAYGFTNKEISIRLGVSVKSVETYKSRAAEKLGLKTRAEI